MTHQPLPERQPVGPTATARCSFWATVALFAVLPLWTSSAQSYVTSWIGNTYGGGKTNKFVAQDAKDACVTADGKVICGTWWDEGQREVAVYWNGGVQDLNNRPKCLAVATDNSSMYFDSEGKIFKYRLLNFSPQDTVVADTTFILGLACAKGRLYASIRSRNLIRIYSTTTLDPVDSFPVTKPRKLAVDTAGKVWVIVDSAGGGNLAPGAGARVICFVNGIEAARITGLLMPTAIAIDNKNRLLIADSGPGREHIRIYSTGSSPALVGTFGRSIFAGDQPGVMAPDKFSHITGVGTDTAGNYYVVWNGIPTSDGEGLVIRALTPQGGLIWEQLGLGFIDVAAPDPADETQVYMKSERFTMDYGQASGKEWKFSAFTLDRHRHRNDVRLIKKHSYCYDVVRIEGRKFMLVTDMWGDYKTLFRFEGEIAIQCLLITPKVNDMSYPPNRPASGQTMWVDGLNGNPLDGDFQTGEFISFSPGWGTVRIDSKSNLWIGTKRYEFGGLDANGIPDYRPDRTTSFPLPAEFTTTKQSWYDADNDQMFLSGYTTGHPDEYSQRTKPIAGRVIYRYDTWSTAPTKSMVYELPHKTAEYEHIRSFDIAGDYIFGAKFGEWGCCSRVYVYDRRTGKLDTIMSPGPEIGGQTGMQDITPSIKAFKRPGVNEYLVFLEEDWFAKVVMFRFRPDGQSTGMRHGRAPSITGAPVSKTGKPVLFNMRGQRMAPGSGPASGLGIYESHSGDMRSLLLSGKSYLEKRQ